MMLCNCSGVTEDEFKKVLTKRKSCTKETIQKVENNVGINCGTCLDRVKEIIQEELKRVKNGNTESI